MKIPRIVHTLTKEVRNNLTEYSHYLVAVSGGADSLALADICATLQGEGFATFTVCHVEHGIRDKESLEDMEFVENFCAEKHLSYVGVHVETLAYAEQNKLSVEDAARQLRYGALRKVMVDVGASKILTAHQADDQAETVLWRFLRGAGLDGLAGMSLENNDVLRPLINVTRKEIIDYLAEKKLNYRLDSTNANLKYTRNKIRQELLPFLANNYNTRILETLSRTAKVLGEDALCLNELAQTEYQKALIESGDALVLDAKMLSFLAPAICKRVLRIACFNFKLTELDFERTQAIYEMLKRNTGNKVIELPQGVTVTLKNHRLIFVNKTIEQ